MNTNPNAGKKTVTVYMRHFLAPSETFVYRQLQGVSSAFHTMVARERRVAQ